jgi:uncharacterized membrane protein YoaT (DUF817 family)
MRAFLWEFLVFGLKSARACIFAGLFFGLLFLSHRIPLFGLARYDFLCLAAVALQILLLLGGLETRDEALTLCAFHFLGLCLELFKTHPAVASWSYPEPGLLKIGTVPIYSGFMYAAVASYMCQSWRILELELEAYPVYLLSVPLSAAIYLNFFSNHFMVDLRWVLAAAVVVVFWRTRVRFRVTQQVRKMPLLLSFLLIGLFVWVAENISTFLGAWVYPEQRTAWQLVSAGKISSWVLLVIVSLLIVADLKHMRAKRRMSESREVPLSVFEYNLAVGRGKQDGALPTGASSNFTGEHHAIGVACWLGSPSVAPPSDRLLR